MHSGSEQLEKESWLLSDGSGALPRAMKLPCSTNRESVTSFPAMLLVVIAMSMVAAGVENNKEKHHEWIEPTCLSGNTFERNYMVMGFRGNNSKWNNSFHQAEVGGTSMASVRSSGAQQVGAVPELEVRSLEACENGLGDLQVHGVQVSVANVMEQLRVQVLGKQNSVNASEEKMPGTCRELACDAVKVEMLEQPVSSMEVFLERFVLQIVVLLQWR
jgi:hypothetical protein